MDSPHIKEPILNRPDKDVLAFNIDEQKAFLNKLNNYKNQKDRNYSKYQFLIAHGFENWRNKCTTSK